MPRETIYQRDLITKLENLFPESFVLKNDPARRQGLPDLLILWGNRWAMLEVKKSASEPTQPNQEYYVNLFNRISFAAIIYPEIEEEVLDDLYVHMVS